MNGQFYPELNIVYLTLSRRNLKTLLLKLDEPDSQRTLVRHQGDGKPSLVIHAEDDEAHYTNRDVPAGEMHPREEVRL